MKKRKNIFIDCTNVCNFCDKSQYKEASFWEKVILNIHLIYCGVCRKYSAKNSKLTRLINTSNIEVLSHSEKKKMKERLKQEIYK